MAPQMLLILPIFNCGTEICHQSTKEQQRKHVMGTEGVVPWVIILSNRLASESVLIIWSHI